MIVPLMVALVVAWRRGRVDAFHAISGKRYLNSNLYFFHEGAITSSNTQFCDLEQDLLSWPWFWYIFF